MSGQLNQVKIDNGLIVNGQRINDITDVKMESNVENLSKVTVTFLGEVDGLDNIDPASRYALKREPDEPCELTDEIETK
ncbi:hypothetical protein J18TS1_12490 [Oceanobacillus oncorhynchi subsp. incaldanensis]|uniref:hypothetical protein n=1 Tax=Oceanobacillus oncorhynchi TaxID=545501 RepID=UPI001B2E0596|nr:hypothetical protein [Oceanobacillus oncorhynchi]GIO18149.1 hypothetical protein J18TS1_12490 [Oceanobacillus oncorhynchi subsp. incaldanensis]